MSTHPHRSDLRPKAMRPPYNNLTRPISEDERRVLPRYLTRRVVADTARLYRDQAGVLAEGLDSSDAPLPKRVGTAGGDPRQLRGVPIYARGVGGVVAGTQPEAETIRRSE